MEIKENRIDDLNLSLTLEITHADYSEVKKKKLTDLRRKVEIKGFRKGMVPASLVEKMYGPQVLVDSVNDVIAETLNKYIAEHSLRIVGEPLPSENTPKTDWKDGNDFTFSFDIAENPEINFELGKDDEVTSYAITVSAEAKKEMKENLLRQYGELTEAETAGEDDFLIVDFTQGETSVEGAYVALRSVAEDIRPAFVGVKAGSELNVNVNEAFTNENDRASMLKCTKEELAAMDPEWKVKVVNVKTFAPAQLNQDTYDKIFGKDAVTDEAGFDAKIEERLRAEYASESDWRLQKDLKTYLLGKAALTLPEAFLKRWIYTINEGKFTMEDIEKEWASFVEDYKWQLIRSYLMKNLDVKIEQADLLASAKGFAAYQFAMYGMNNVPDEQLEEFAKRILSQEKESRRIEEQVEDEKTLRAAKELVSLKSKKISVEKFRELA